MKSFDPPTDAELHDQEMERRARRARPYIKIDLENVLELVDGIMVEIDGSFIVRADESGEIEVESGEITHIRITGSARNAPFLKLDEEHLKDVNRTFYEKLVHAVDKRVLRKARLTGLMHWRHEDVD